ncbi:CbiX/SirB N-terminal domain-containing protein [soil metagenome]
MPDNPRLPPVKTAIVLIAHGSRNADANADATYFAEQLQNSGIAVNVKAAYLELAEPTIPQAVESLIKNLPEVVILLPYFLSAGVHVRRDLAELCVRFRNDHPQTVFQLAEPIGRHTLLQTILLERAREALLNCPSA